MVLNRGSIFEKFPTLPVRPYVSHGKGAAFFTEDGRRILDATSGVTGGAVLGNDHPGVVEALRGQLGRISHVSFNTWNSRVHVELADLLVSRAPEGLDKVYYAGLSGSEAVEAALKLSFQLQRDAGRTAKTKILCFEGAFHGATSQALAASGVPIARYFDDVAPSNLIRIEGGDVEGAIERAGPENVATIVGETLGGSNAGIRPVPPGFWKTVRGLCDCHAIHLVLDEVFCGLGRTGRLHACEHEGVTPDFLVLGKALAAGFVPFSAVLTRSAFQDALAEGPNARVMHGHTYQGHVLGATAALAAQKVIHDPDMLRQINALSEIFHKGLERISGLRPWFGERRARGLALALDYGEGAPADLGARLQKVLEEDFGVLVNARGPRLMLLPPYVMSDAEAEEVLSAVTRAVEGITP